MKKLLVLLMLIPLFSYTQRSGSANINRWKKQAENITIIRDNWESRISMARLMLMLSLVCSMHNARMISSEWK